MNTVLSALALQLSGNPTPPPPPPPPPPREFVELGVGERACSEWTAFSPEERHQRSGWLEGYLTGLNEYGPVADGGSVRKADLPKAVSLLDDVCRRDPERSIARAARTVGGLFLQLRASRQEQIP